MSKSLYTNQQPERAAEMNSIHNIAKKLPTNQYVENNNEVEDSEPKKVSEPVMNEPKIISENTLINVVSSQLEEEEDKYKKPKTKIEEIKEAIIPETKETIEKKKNNEQPLYTNPAIAACMRNAQEIEEQEKEEKSKAIESPFEKTLNKYA